MRHHLLAGYRRSLQAIVRSQFTSKAARGGREGAISLLESSSTAGVSVKHPSCTYMLCLPLLETTKMPLLLRGTCDCLARPL